MKVFVTGATGFIGRNLTLKLAEARFEVHALYRDLSRTQGLQHENIKWFRGNLSDRDSLADAMKGCVQACHLGAFATLLVKRPEIIYDQNVQGTVNLLECASEMGLQRVVFISTAGVFGPSKGEVLDETAPCPENFLTHYLRSKALAEQKVLEFAERGMDICIVNPTRVYGPGLLSTSNAARIVDLYLRGKWRIIPGRGKMMGNYVFVDDVSDGIIQAMEKGRKGERYLLGGENISFKEFLDATDRITGRKRLLVRVPVFLILWLAHLLLFFAKLSGRTPPFTPGEVNRITQDWLISSEKAGRELAYKPRSFEEGIKITIEWLNSRSTP